MRQNNKVHRCSSVVVVIHKVVDGHVDKCVLVGFVVDKVEMVEKRAYVRARFTPMRTYVLL